MERMANQQGLSLIKVKKEELVNTLKENRLKHIKDFEEAKVAFQEDVVKELKTILRNAKNGKIKTSIHFDEPSQHTDDYDTVIEMLEMSVDDEVYLTRNEFKQYVRDEWNWKDSFIATNSFYLDKVK